MFLTFMNQGESENINVNPSALMSDIIDLYSQKTKIPAYQISLTYQGNPVNPSQTPTENKIIPGSVLIVYVNKNTAPPVKSETRVPHADRALAPSLFGSDTDNRTSRSRSPARENHSPQSLAIAKQFCENMMADPARLNDIFSKVPVLGQAIVNNDYNTVASYLKKAQSQQDTGPNVAGLDEMSPEYQKRVEQYIREKNIDSNLKNVIEHHPELLGVPDMLYIHAKIRNKEYTCFVDTGAQTTIMSKKVAEETGLMRLVDTRYSTTLKGVGTDKSVGRIHLAKLEIGGKHFPSSFVVVNNLGGIDILLGLDMLKRHQAYINLKDNSLSFATGATVPFLPASKVPRSMFGKNPSDSMTEPVPPIITETSTSAPSVNVKSESPKVSDSLGFSSGATTTPSTPAVGTGTVPETSTLPPGYEQKIAVLERMGFPRQQAIQALKSVNGNLKLAIEMFLS